MDGPWSFAAASFESQDAGSGPVHSSPTVGPVATAVHNISSRHLHDIGNSLPDDRQFLRSWRRQLSECLQQKNASMIRFLVAGVGAGDGADEEAEAPEVFRRCQDVLAKYSKSTWNFASSVRDLQLSTSMDAAVSDICGELGVSPTVIHEAQRRAIRAYTQSAAAVCAAEARLEEKLKRLDTVSERIGAMMFLEPTAELEALAPAARAYLDSVYDRIDIEPEYNELIGQYKRFAALRGIVGLSQFQRPAPPTCTICLAKEVNHTVTPCGHTFCEDCVRTQMTTCHMCRVQVRDRVRIYFS